MEIGSLKEVIGRNGAERNRYKSKPILRLVGEGRAFIWSISSTNTSIDRGGLAVTLLQLLNARGQVLVGGYHLTQADERLDNGDAHLNRTRAVENGRQHAPRRAP
jgi:hypothetical protein